MFYYGKFADEGIRAMDNHNIYYVEGDNIQLLPALKVNIIIVQPRALARVKTTHPRLDKNVGFWLVDDQTRWYKTHATGW